MRGRCPRAEHVSEPSRGPVSQPRSCPRLPALGRGRGAIFRGGQAGAPVALSCSRRVACPDVFVSQGSLRGSVFMRRGGDDVFFVSLN